MLGLKSVVGLVFSVSSVSLVLLCCGPPDCFLGVRLDLLIVPVSGSLYVALFVVILQYAFIMCHSLLIPTSYRFESSIETLISFR